jgi:serine/threonine-protein kinase
MEFPSELADRYECHGVLGCGGMGVVFRARDRRIDRAVALKVLAPLPDQDAELEARFIQEARLAARVRHPSVVEVLDADRTPAGTLFITYELVEGEDLQALVRRVGALPPVRAVGLAIALLEGLQAIHAAGIVHRDIKPANVRSSPDGALKILDFGIALDELGARVRTRTGIILGTPAFLAPEVIQGQRAGPAADVYAAGALVYELLTGVPPYEDEAIARLLERHLRSPVPDATERAPHVPPGLSRLVQALLAKSPADRPTTGVAVVALRALGLGDSPEGAGHGRRSPGPSPRPPPGVPSSATLRVPRPRADHPGGGPPAGSPGRRPAVAVLAAGGVIAAAIVIAALLVVRRAPEARPAAASLTRTPAAPAVRPQRSLEDLLGELTSAEFRSELTSASAGARLDVHERILVLLGDRASAGGPIGELAEMLVAGLALLDLATLAPGHDAQSGRVRRAVELVRDRTGPRTPHPPGAPPGSATGSTRTPPVRLPDDLVALLSELEDSQSNHEQMASLAGPMIAGHSPVAVSKLREAIARLVALPEIQTWGEAGARGALATRVEALLLLARHEFFATPEGAAARGAIARWLERLAPAQARDPTYWRLRSDPLLAAPGLLAAGPLLRWPALLLLSGAPGREPDIQSLLLALARMSTAFSTVELVPGGDPAVLDSWLTLDKRFALFEPVSDLLATKELAFIDQLESPEAVARRLAAVRSVRRPELPEAAPLLGLALADALLRQLARSAASGRTVTPGDRKAEIQRAVHLFVLRERIVDLGVLVADRRGRAIAADRDHLRHQFESLSSLGRTHTAAVLPLLIRHWYAVSPETLATVARARISR